MAFCALVVSLDIAKPNQRPGKSHDEVIKTKPNQRRGESRDEVMKAKLSLDRKVAKFRAKVAASNIKEPDMAMMQKHFSLLDLRALWGRLATQRNKEDITIRQAWSDLTSKTSEVAKLCKGSCNQVKNDALAQWVCFPHAWQSRLLRNVESMRQLRGLGLEVQKQTVGDMWQQTHKGL